MSGGIAARTGVGFGRRSDRVEEVAAANLAEGAVATQLRSPFRLPVRRTTG